MNNNWKDIYYKEIEQNGSLVNYFKEKIKVKKKLIDLIEKYSPNKKVIEAGCGTGVVSIYLASLGYEVNALDIDEGMLELSNNIALEYNSINKPNFIRGSIFDLNYEKDFFDVAFSNGVLEHFSDDEIKDTLKKQMNISKTLIFGIPTMYFDQDEATFGDERFLPLDHWRKLIKESQGEIIEEKSYHFLSKIKILLDFKKYFRPYPFRIFVIKKKNQN